MTDREKIFNLCAIIPEKLFNKHNIRSVSSLLEAKMTMLPVYIFRYLDDTCDEFYNEKVVIKKLEKILEIREKKLKRLLDII